MKIERSTMSILDVGVGLSKIEKHNINFESKLSTITNLLQMYSQRDLSVCRKILITKTLGISKILHQLSIIDVNKSFLDRLQSEQIHMGIQTFQSKTSCLNRRKYTRGT